MLITWIPFWHLSTAPNPNQQPLITQYPSTTPMEALTIRSRARSSVVLTLWTPQSCALRSLLSLWTGSTRPRRSTLTSTTGRPPCRRGRESRPWRSWPHNNRCFTNRRETTTSRRSIRRSRISRTHRRSSWSTRGRSGCPAREGRNLTTSRPSCTSSISSRLSRYSSARGTESSRPAGDTVSSALTMPTPTRPVSSTRTHTIKRLSNNKRKRLSTETAPKNWPSALPLPSRSSSGQPTSSADQRQFTNSLSR